MPRDTYRVPVGGVSPEELSKRLSTALEAARAKLPPGVGVTLFAFDYGAGGGLTYISTARRSDMIRVVEEWLAHQRRLS